FQSTRTLREGEYDPAIVGLLCGLWLAVWATAPPGLVGTANRTALEAPRTPRANGGANCVADTYFLW
ncbi:MAG TPA: hypothetical protein VGX76_22860, partial [Pirellulales bacterium]|nr:hypothetical protein [Pirellulales bacterium]